ncbi:hypothetical protein [Microvirga yunnanensis]|nr:hypothetical protein [Microvirga sp. HBU65207]
MRQLKLIVKEHPHVVLDGIEIIHMMRNQHANYACIPRTSLPNPFDLLAV